MPEADSSIGIVLCECRGLIPGRLDLAQVAHFLREIEPRAEIATAEALCEEPGRIEEMAREGLTSLVIGACTQEPYLHLLREKARRGGLDPFSLEVASLRDRCALVHPGPQATLKAKLLLASLLLRAQAFPGTSAENLRSRLSPPRGKIARRDLFRLPRTSYQVVPVVEAGLCAAWKGCQLCLESCPFGAIKVEGGRALIEKEKCEGCGICLQACPTTALNLPTLTPEQVDYQMQGLLSHKEVFLGPRMLLLACRGGSALLDDLAEEGMQYPANLLPLEVPCLARVPPLWLIRAFDLGAWGVALLPCTKRCLYDHETSLLEGDLLFTKALLGSLGIEGRRLHLLQPTEAKELASQLNAFAAQMEHEAPHPLLKREPARMERGGIRLSSLVLELLRQSKVLERREIREGSIPFGRLRVESALCTFCAVCSAHCPTAALSLEEGETVRLAFFPSACTGCKECIRFCPIERGQKALEVEQGLDWDLLEQPQVLLAEGRMLRCQECGEPYAPESMVQRVQQRIQRRGDDFDLSYLTRYCPSCRVRAQIGHRIAQT